MSDKNQDGSTVEIKRELENNDDDSDEDLDETDEEENDEIEKLPEKPPADVSQYTLEEKIVAAVWVHERVRNHMTWDQMMKNFKHRFRNKPPSKQTLLCWERKLFTTGNAHDKSRSGRPIARLMHVPYVKQSIEEQPNLSIRERAKELGLPYATLLKILKEDLKMAYVPDVDAPKKKSTLYSPNVGGKWKFINETSSTEESSNKKQKTSNGTTESDKTNEIYPTEVVPVVSETNTAQLNNFNQNIASHQQIPLEPQQSSSSNYYAGLLPTNQQIQALQVTNLPMVPALYQNYPNIQNY